MQNIYRTGGAPQAKTRKIVTSGQEPCNETKLYIAAGARGEKRSQKREEELSRAWTAAASALHGIDDDLARRCRFKGEYWAEPDQWSTQQIADARIGLSEVSAAADTLLGWQAPPLPD